MLIRRTPMVRTRMRSRHGGLLSPPPSAPRLRGDPRRRQCLSRLHAQERRDDPADRPVAGEQQPDEPLQLARDAGLVEPEGPAGPARAGRYQGRQGGPGPPGVLPGSSLARSRAPNGAYSISVTDTGIALRAPGASCPPRRDRHRARQRRFDDGAGRDELQPCHGHGPQPRERRRHDAADGQAASRRPASPTRAYRVGRDLAVTVGGATVARWRDRGRRDRRHDKRARRRDGRQRRRCDATRRYGHPSLQPRPGDRQRHPDPLGDEPAARRPPRRRQSSQTIKSHRLRVDYCVWRAPAPRETAPRGRRSSLTRGPVSRSAARPRCWSSWSSRRPAARPLYQACLNGVGLFALLVAIARGVRTGTDRRAHLLLAAGFVLTGVAAGLGMPSGHVAAPPDAFAGDVLWLARYPLLYGALAVLLRSRGPRLGLGQVVDGLLGAFAAASVFVLVTPHLVHASPTAVLRSVYPVLDVLVVGFLVGAALLNGWRLAHWLPLMLGILAFGICETVDVQAMLVHPSAAPMASDRAGVRAVRLPAARRRRVRAPAAPSGTAAGSAFDRVAHGVRGRVRGGAALLRADPRAARRPPGSRPRASWSCSSARPPPWSRTSGCCAAARPRR